MLIKANLSIGNNFRYFRLLKLLSSLLLFVFLQACSIKYGILPNVSSLGKLQQGVSTKADVLMLLGEPRGKGKTKFTASIQYPFDIWFYEYLQSDGKVNDFKFLLVFMDKDIYHGYLWFASKDLTGSEIK